MFTGIIIATTPIVRHKQAQDGLLLSFKKPTGWNDLGLGESVATDGVCLTVAQVREQEYDCHLVPETLAKTSFGRSLPSKVNLERSLSMKDRLGGHFVQGHVDDVGIVKKISSGSECSLEIEFNQTHKDQVIHKGSIAINGVSLTIAWVKGNAFSVALIPHTLKHTTLGDLEAGDIVNLEFDMIGKYIAKIMENRSAKG